MVKRAPRPFAVERRALAPRRPAPPPVDPHAELHAVAELLQDVPRESLASMADILFHNRRMAGRIRAVVENLPVEETARERAARSWQAPARLAAHPRSSRRAPQPKREQMELSF